MKKILINFDGTCNEPGDAENKKNLSDESISNILRIHLLAGGNLENTSSIHGQRSFYYSGVGTRGSIFKRLWRALFAAQAPENILKEATADLERNYTPGDKIFVSGFSRGAAIARMFASQLAKNEKLPGIEIEFLGVFDTVAAFGLPNLEFDERPVSDVIFEDNFISPIINNALHLVSLDENRLAFRPTLMNEDPRVEEIWFPGVHSDVGGGYYNRGLSDVALEYWLEKAGEHGLFFLKPSDIPLENLSGIDQNGDPVEIGIDDLEMKPDTNGKVHYHQEWWRGAKTIAPRDAVVLKKNVPSDGEINIHRSVKEKMVVGYMPVAMI